MYSQSEDLDVYHLVDMNTLILLVQGSPEAN